MAFTEQGVAMLSSVLKSERAIEDSDYHIYDLLSKLSHDFGFNSYASVSEEVEVVDISVKGTDGCPQK